MVNQPPNEDDLNDEPWSTMKILNAQPPTSININSINNNINTISNYQQQPDTQPQTPNTHNNEHSSLSIFERLRHFLYINFVLNKRSFILSILSYAADIILFVSLNLFLFSNKKFIYELSCSLSNNNNNHNNNVINFSTSSTPNIIRTTTNLTHDLLLNQTNINNSLERTNNILSELEQPTKTLKQSYLSLQIIILFVFFICFILSYLIKLQFKYHRLALNMYDYDVEMNINNPDKDRDGIDSLASTTTGSHFSSSVNKKLSSLLKRILNRLFTKLASILLNFFFGYQFCQNCFIQQPNETNDGYSIFIHIFIMICVLFRCFIIFLNKKNSKNQLNHLNKLQQKQKDLFNDINNKHNHKYFYYYYSYLIRSNQIQCNQLKQHQNNQNTFRIFQLDDISLFLGFISSLFHLFTFLKAFELVFVFLPLLFTLILFRFKSSLNAVLNLSLIVMSLLIISNSNSFSSITDISSYYLEKKYIETNTNNSPIVAKLLSNPNNTTTTTNNENINISRNECNSYYDYHNIQNSSSIINLFSYNLITFFCFLLTFYFKSILSIYYCTLTGLERWNLSFLCKLSFWRKLSIYISFLVYLLFILTCTIALCIKLKNWSLLSLPFYLFISFIWACFQLLNTINLTHLMNKINDCFLLLNESNSLSQANSFENSSNHSKKSKSSQIYNNNNPVCSTNSNNNRNSTLSQSSGNNNNSKGSFKLKKFLQRFLSYDKLNMNDEIINDHMNVSNVPIHRILAYKGVRHLGSISYRISLYCFFQTILLAPFAFYTNSPITIGMYLITLSLNFIWLSLLYQFPKSNSGTCIAHAIVAPPLILNIYNNGTLATNNSSTLNTNNPFLSSLSKKSSTTNSSSGTYTTTTTSSTNGNSLLFLPFNYQQALTQRCTYLLNKIQMFLQFHLIENFGCDFASNGLNKDGLESKLRNFFQKRSNDGSYYNTYVLYYCGPTSNLTDNLAFVDGNELGIEQICEIWKKVHLNDDIDFKESDDKDEMEKVIISANENENDNVNNNGTGSGSGSGSEEEIKQENQIENIKKTKTNKDIVIRKKEKKNFNSRLIIILDAENTSKSLNYIKTKLNEPNLYVALQTVKYNLNNSSGQCGLSKTNTSKSKGFENKLVLGDKTFKSSVKQSLMGPGSPQTISGNFFDSYLNFGKFTLDWIKSNCNSSNINSYENENLNNQLEFINQNENFFYHNNDFDEEEENELMNKDREDEEDEEDDDDESNEYDMENANGNNNSGVEKHTIKAKKNVINSNTNGNNNNGKSHRNSSAFFYEAKCAFSRYWLDFNFETKNEKALAHDFNQFWNLYYPYLICKPLLKLLNCRIFYLRFNFVRRIIFTLRHIKTTLIPMHEYDTGHGFKIFNN